MKLATTIRSATTIVAVTLLLMTTKSTTTNIMSLFVLAVRASSSSSSRMLSVQQFHRGNSSSMNSSISRSVTSRMSSAGFIIGVNNNNLGKNYLKTKTKQQCFYSTLGAAGGSTIHHSVWKSCEDIMFAGNNRHICSPHYYYNTNTFSPSQLYANTNNNEEEYSESSSSSSTEIEPTWTYVPYKPPPKKTSRKKSKRNFSSSSSYSNNNNNNNFHIPNKITIPLDQIELSFVRSSGAGGQNVNKLNTKVELRFHLPTATWIPNEVRQRIQSNESNRINKDGYLSLTSQEFRTQAQNKKNVLDKLEEIVLKSYPRPKVRKMRKGISKGAKLKNREDKKRRSMTKVNRKKVDF